MTETTETETSPEAQKLANDLALSLWKATTQASGDDKPENAEARKAAWAAAKPAMKKAARKLLKNLDDAGYVIAPKG